MGLLITAFGVPVYMLCIRWRDKPVWFQQALCKTLLQDVLFYFQYMASLVSFFSKPSLQITSAMAPRNCSWVSRKTKKTNIFINFIDGFRGSDGKIKET